MSRKNTSREIVQKAINTLLCKYEKEAIVVCDSNASRQQKSKVLNRILKHNEKLISQIMEVDKQNGIEFEKRSEFVMKLINVNIQFAIFSLVVSLILKVIGRQNSVYYFLAVLVAFAIIAILVFIYRSILKQYLKVIVIEGKYNTQNSNQKERRLSNYGEYSND